MSFVPPIKNFKIDGETFDVRGILSCEFESVAQAAEVLPSAIAWLGWQRAACIERRNFAERELERVEATVFFELKATGGWEGAGLPGKSTDASMRYAVRLDQRTDDAFQKWVEAEKWVNIVTTQIEAIRAKLELVRTTEATRRRLVEPVPTDEELGQRRNRE